MNERKNHRIPDYEILEGDDIRTIPDFYDNLYPTAENCAPQSQKPPIRKTKKSDFQKNNEK